MGASPSGHPFVTALRRRRAWVALALGALIVYGIGSVAWPLAGGRDTGTYLAYYLDIGSSRPAYPTLMLFRTPGTPLFFGPLLQLGGAALTEVVMGFAYAASILAFTAAARTFGRRCAIAVAVSLLLYTPYNALFHQVSSDSLFAFAFALWALGVMRVVRDPSTLRFALLGVGLVALVLVRPSAQVLILLALGVLVVGASWRNRLVWAGTFVAVAAALLVGWAGYNDARYGEFTVARGGPANLPSYRVFVIDRLVSPENGPASRAFANAVRNRLLTVWPYRQYHVTDQAFFASMNDNYWNDAVVLTDDVWGWNTDYGKLRTVALEAIRRHPKAYARSVVDATWFSFKASYTLPARHVRSVSSTATPTTVSAPPPVPGPGGIPPSYRLWWVMSTPDHRVVYTRAGLIWKRHSDEVHVARLTARIKALTADLPDRSGSQRIASILNAWGRIFPRMFLWLAAGLVALLIRRPRDIWPVVALSVLGALVVVVTVAGLPPVLDYRVPFDPAFILFAAACLTAARRSASPTAQDRVLAEPEDAEEERRE